MNTRIVLLCLACLLVPCSRSAAQTADQWVAQGRALAARQDHVGAEARFAAALQLAPDHEAANALRGLSRILALPARPAVSNLLDRLGMAATNRSLLRWTAQLPLDTNGVPLAPERVDAQEVINTLRSVVVPELQGAAANFSRLTRPQFLLELSAEETTTTAVTLDLGDARLLQAACHLGAFLGLTLNTWNWEAQLRDLRSLATEADGTVESLLALHPALFSSAHADDLPAARQALQSMIEAYLVASAWIRARPLSEDRLFNWDEGQAGDEARFRETLVGIRDSLVQGVPWSAVDDLTVSWDQAFSPGFAPRRWLPEFAGNDFVLGTLPTPVLGGVIPGLLPERLERFMVEGEVFNQFGLHGVPKLAAPAPDGNSWRIPVTVMAGRSYAILGSTDLRSWVTLGTAVPQQGVLEIQVPVEAEPRFFAVSEMTRPVNDAFQSPIRLAGPSLEWRQTLAGATRQTNELGNHPGDATVWWEWEAPGDGIVALVDRALDGAQIGAYLSQAGGSWNAVAPVRWGSLVFPVTRGQIYRLAAGSLARGGNREVHLSLTLRPPPANDSLAQALELVGERVEMNGYLAGATHEAGETFAAGQSPRRGVWFRWTAPRTSRYRVWVEPAVGQVDVALFRVLAGPPGMQRVDRGYAEEIAFEAVAGDQFLLRAEEVFEFAVDFRLFLAPVDPPANDNFGQRVLVTGTKILQTGTTTGSTVELGEPGDLDPSQAGSVWYRWVAPADGVLEFALETSSPHLIQVISGSSLFNLTDLTAGFIGDGTLRVRGGQEYSMAVRTLWGRRTGDFMLKLELHQIPPNDDFTGRLILPVESGMVEADNTHASREAGEPGDGSGSLWWVWVAPESGLLELSLERLAFLPRLEVFRGNQLGNLTTLGQRTGEGRLSQRVTAGDVLVIRVQGNRREEAGRFLLRYRFVRPPPNDHFANRITFTGEVASGSADTTAATKEASEPWHAGVEGGNSAWWSWKAPHTRVVTVHTAGSSFNTTLAVYTGLTPSQLTLVASNNDAQFAFASRSTPGGTYSEGRGFGVSTSEVAFLAQAGETYQIAVDGTGGRSGIVRLAIEADGSPGIVLQPASAFVPAGSPWTVSVNAAGEGPLKYQWFRDQLPIPGATASQLEIPSVEEVDRVYQVVVSNRLGTRASSPAVAFVVPPNDHLASATPLSGTNASGSGFNRRATSEAGEPRHAGHSASRSVWWTWTAPSEGQVLLNTAGSTFNTLLAVYRGDAMSGLALVAANNDALPGGASQVSFPAMAGSTYRIAVDGYVGLAGSIRVNLSLQGLRLGSDGFSTASVLSGVTALGGGSNANATAEPGEPRHAGVSPSKSLWWKWTAPSAGTVTIETAGSNFDTVLGVYTGTQLAGLTAVASNDDDGSELTSRVRFPVVAGQTYFIAVDRYGGAETGQVMLGLVLSVP